ncbi:DUF2993 domain-containing protein [Streptomyces sp. NPDC058378]|uniref:LmeA family phospholipid-binding protein n=1 Tax=Streptomyces sp. NPDC058378 TaxID=3346469 RepID=UPI003660E0C5
MESVSHDSLCIVSVMTLFRGLPRRGRSRRRAAVVAVTVLALTGAAGAAEMMVRFRIADRFAAGAEERLGQSPDVGLGGTPALWQLAQGAFPDVELEAKGASVNEMMGLDIDAHLHDVRRGPDAVTVRSSTVDVGIGAESLAGERLQQVNGTIVPEPASGRLILRAGPGGAITLPLTPSLDSTSIRITPERPTFNGSPLPAAMSERITEKVRHAVELDSLPLELRPQRLTVTDDGLSLSLRGGPATLDT